MPTSLDITPALKRDILDGNVVLFLGSGASLGTTDSNGNFAPSTPKLASLLAERFLGGLHSSSPLDIVGEMAASETNLTEVQLYIRELLNPLNPSEAHKLLPTFRWKAIVTTNYDQLVEKAYAQVHNPVQRIVPIVENGDLHIRLAENEVRLIKMHGCITKATNETCPYVLTPDQYATARRGRERIFAHIKELVSSHTVLFIGYSLIDSDFRIMLAEIHEETNSRPRFHLVSPSLDAMLKRSLEQRHITGYAAKFDEFMSELNTELDSPFRQLSISIEGDLHPIYQKLKRGSSLTDFTTQFLNNDVDYVESVNNADSIDPLNFYKGLNPGWSSVIQDLDIRRSLMDTILAEHFLVDETQHSQRTELIVIKSSAGGGKSVLLKRLAWDASKDYQKICLFLKSDGLISHSNLDEIIKLSEQRVYLFIDRASTRIREIKSIINNIGDSASKLTIITSERPNEWNLLCDELSPFVTNSYELKYLMPSEINYLIEKLDTHNALGELRGLSHEERFRALKDKASSQLLVALHEVTSGRPFEEIIEDEYNKIRPREAQSIYLTICVLYRLEIPVRAGIIARLYGIPFERFKEELFRPLENVVYSEYKGIVQDHVYYARHPHISQIVFERVLASPVDLFDYYTRVLRHLTIDFSDDYRAYRQMVRGRVLLELFSDVSRVDEIFGIAKELCSNDDFEKAYVLHQQAIFEMRRDGGDLRKAEENLASASLLSSNDFSIHHSMSELKLRMADSVARTELERNVFIQDAIRIARRVRTMNRSSPHGIHTLSKAWMKVLEEQINNEVPEDVISPTIRHIEQIITDGLQDFPGDEYLKSAEADFAAILSNSSRVVKALEDGFRHNPHSAYMALRLAKVYRLNGDKNAALDILKQSLDFNGGDKKLHFACADLLLEVDPLNNTEILSHLRQSFSRADRSDRNHLAQLLYGRQLFIVGQKRESQEVFNNLSTARIGEDYRFMVRYPLPDVFNGHITRIESAFCIIQRLGINETFYARRAYVEGETWRNICIGRVVQFKIGFNFRGPVAFDVLSR